MTVRVGVVGCGWWSTEAHLPGIVEHPEASLTAIADPSEANRTRAQTEFGANSSYATAEEMLEAEDLDAVVVATPPAHHFAPAAASLGAGINVLVEKPMTIGASEARELVALAEQSGAELAVGYTWHFSPHVVALKQAIASGRIGAVEHVSSFFGSVARGLYEGRPDVLKEALGSPPVLPATDTYSDPAVAGGGQVQTQLTHNLALLLHLTGLHPRRVAAFLQSFELEVDVADAVSIAFDEGAVGSIDSVGSMLAGQDEILECRILGREGHVLLDVTKGTASIHEANGAVEELPGLSADPGKVENLARYPQTAPVANLIDVTLGRAENINPGTLGLLVVETIDAIYESARDSRVVDLGPSKA